MSEHQATHCHKEGGCLDQNGRAMQSCPSGMESKRQYELSPLVPAERLCLRAISSVVESRSHGLVDSLASVSYDLDRAIAAPQVIWDEDGLIEHDFREAKKTVFKQTVAILHSAQAQSLEALQGGDHLSSALQLKRLAIFMPAFKTRVEGTPLTRDLMNRTHDSLCWYIADLQSQMHRKGNNNARKKVIAAHLAECEAMGLLSRRKQEDIFPWPALAREEASHARSQHNHDFYTLRKGRKSPFQIKTSSNGKGYRGVAVIQQYDIFRSMKRDPTTQRRDWAPPKGHQDYEWPNPYVYEQMLVGEAPDPIAQLLVEEVRLGTHFPKDKKNALSLATSYILSRAV